MRTELMALRLAVLVLATAVVGCGGSNGLSCGPGTHLLAGKCLPNVQVDACGPGTAQHGLECLPIGPDAGGDGSAPDVGPDTTADGAANPEEKLRSFVSDQTAKFFAEKQFALEPADRQRAMETWTTARLGHYQRGFACPEAWRNAAAAFRRWTKTAPAAT